METATTFAERLATGRRYVLHTIERLRAYGGEVIDVDARFVSPDGYGPPLVIEGETLPAPDIATYIFGRFLWIEVKKRRPPYRNRYGQYLFAVEALAFERYCRVASGPWPVWLLVYCDGHGSAQPAAASRLSAAFAHGVYAASVQDMQPVRETTDGGVRLFWFDLRDMRNATARYGLHAASAMLANRQPQAASL